MANTLSFIGLGAMGHAMARNLLKGGEKLFIYNRTLNKGDDLIQEGAKWLSTPADALSQASIVLTMVANDEALNEITLGPEGVLTKATPGSLHISLSTVSPDATLELAKIHREKGVEFLAAPVFGRPEAAIEQNLVICMAGSSKAKQQAEPILKHLGKKIYDFGQEPEKANTVKLTGNFLILSLVEIVAEAFAFAKKSGISLEPLYECFSNSFLSCPVFKTYGRLIIDQKFTPASFKMSLGLKDINLFLDAAQSVGAVTPIADLLQNRLIDALSKHQEEMDWSAIALSSFEHAGLISEIKD